MSIKTDVKWFWMMSYCKEHAWPPANKVFWALAERAFNNKFKS